MVDVPVLKPLTYAGLQYRAGQMIRLPELDAAMMARKGMVSLTRGLPRADVPPITPKRRQYRRRDLTAESS